MDPKSLLQTIEQALADKKFSEVSRLLDELDPVDFTSAEAVALLAALKKKRRFSDLERAASLFLSTGKCEPAIRLHWAQSLLDQNRIAPAMDVLRLSRNEIEKKGLEASEVIGLMGRGFKQRYINHGDPQDLHNAVDAYLNGWALTDEDYRWHGVNLLALADRAKRDGIELTQAVDSNQIAYRVLTEVTKLDEPQSWDCAVAMEASLALGDKESLEHWLKQFIANPGSDAFEVASVLRQMKEVWQLEGTEFGQAFLPVLEYELLHSEGGEVRVTSGKKVSDRSGFEAVYGHDSYTQVEWMDSLRTRMLSVARVQHSQTGRPKGTGFLIRGGDLHSEWGDKLMFVTNSHVVSDQAVDRAPLRPERACAEFTLAENRPKYPLGKKVFYSERMDLDTWICEIDVPDHIKPLDLSFFNPLLPESASKKERCFVAGHPYGGDIVVSLFDNALVGIKEPYVHYRSPTARGSSGSPVFNLELDVFALHHRACDDLDANEGVSIKFIQEAVDA